MSSPVRKGPNPFLLVGLTVLSAASFFVVVKYRENRYPASEQRRQADHPLVPPRRKESEDSSRLVHNGSDLATKKPALDSEKVTVLFVLGGPGSGKGTQSANLVEDFGFAHLSAGDLLRAEQNRPGSEFGELIRTYIKEGQIVPVEVTIKLIENAIRAVLTEDRQGEAWADGKGRFLIDGFPRKMDQALLFDEELCESKLVLFMDTTEEIMCERLLERGKTSGREDDNEESIKKRFKVYKEQTRPVIDYYLEKGKVAAIPGSGTIDEVHALAKAVVQGQVFKA